MKKIASTVVMVIAAALALGACSDDDAGTASPPASATPSGAPTTTLPVIPAPSDASGPPANPADQNICKRVVEAGTAMNKEVREAAAKNAKDYQPVKKALTAFASKTSTVADGQTSAVAQAAQGLAKAASDGAAAANPMTAMNEGEYTKFFATFKEACAAAGVPFQA